MYLLRAELHGVGPFEQLELPFADEQERPRRLVVVHGGAGVGKTSLLAAITTSRPGHAIAQPARAEFGRPAYPATPSWVVTDWLLGQDDPERPHALRVASPNVKLHGGEDAELTRRREQALFDRVATEGGFACLTFSAARWFSRQPIGIAAPSRSVARYDVKQAAAFDDASRSDLARETKQALAYAEIGSALVARQPGAPELRFDALGDAMFEVVSQLSELTGFRYARVDALSWEPLFRAGDGALIGFDALPTRARHLVALAALSVRTLWAAYPDRDPRQSEGVVLIDELDLHQDAATACRLPGALRAALPEVQWIVTTNSPLVASAAAIDEVLALRRVPGESRIELFSGTAAVTH
jgi:hypothetical protein